MIIGIDLGTTYSLAAYLTNDGPRLIPNALGNFLTPSCVGLDKDNRLLVGAPAKELQVLQPDRCAALFKRYMGSDWTANLDGSKYTPEQLSSLVLRALKEDAEAHLQQAVTRAVITVPAYFNDNQRTATLRAGEMAGLQVERILNEPTAAAIAYGLHQDKDSKIVVVFDLGGGTFDVSVVELFEGAVEVRASCGECFLGGEDFTRALAARVLERHNIIFETAEVKHPLLVSRLIQQCERAKRRLTTEEQVPIALPDKQGEINENSPQTTITRADFQKWTAHILAQTEMPIRRGLGDAKLTRHDINEVVLVGGATRMPAVVDLVRGTFGKEPHRRLNPDEVVALGAAVQAGLIAQHSAVKDLVVTDVCPFTLGIEISKEMGGQLKEGYFLPVINRNTTIPTSRVETVSTTRANQASVECKVYQGESRRVEDNLLLGKFSVKGIPTGPRGQLVDVRFTYDLNGVLEVEATIVVTQQKASLVITKHAQGLSAEQVRQAVEHMAAMKTHPREDTVNRFLLRRSERLFRELPLSDRARLMDLIDGFEDVLERQDAEAIRKYQELLKDFLDQFDLDGGHEPELPDDDRE